MNRDDRTAILREYVLGAGASDDVRLREALEQTCPECAGELAQAEADLALLAFDLPARQPPAGLRDRVLARIQREKPTPISRATPPLPTAVSTANRGGPGGTTTTATRPWPGRGILTSMILAIGCVIALVLVVEQGDAMKKQLANQDAILQSMRADQQTSAQQMNDVIERLKRTRSLAEGVRERDNQIAVLNRRLRDLELLAVNDGRQKDLELASLREQLDILRSNELTVHALTGASQPGAQVRLFADRANHRWLIAGEGVKDPGAQRCYELWMVTSDGRKLASKTFVPDATGGFQMMVDVPVNEDMAAAAFTDEPTGGVAVATGTIQLLASLK